MIQRCARFGLALMTFSAVLSSCRPLLAQAPARAPSVEAPGPAPAPRIEDRDANETRERFRQLLRQYPPSLAEVLQLDPSLLTNEAYLAPYPGLSAFLSQHPQIAHNPAFFVGEPNRYRWEAPNPRADAFRMWEQMFSGLALIIVFTVVTGVLAWLVRLLIEYRRWLRLSRIQTEVHSKLLDRFTSNDDLRAYMETAAGQKFLEAAPIPIDQGPRSIGAPLGRILWSVQAGLVLALGGIGLQYVSTSIIDDARQPVHAMGVLALMFGIGFILSAVIAYLLSRRLGLLEAANPGATRASRTQTSQEG
jgi:hypothetical protein